MRQYLKDKIKEYGATLDFLRHRKRSYQLAMMSPAGQDVLRDLAKFCRADRSCFDADPRLHAVAEGRREVWLRIQQHLNLSSEELFVLYGGGTIQLQSED
jgi:hypothetical protein